MQHARPRLNASKRGARVDEGRANRTKNAPSIDVDALFRAHERFVFGVAYRMTGSRADSEDVVQQTFTRALERSRSGSPLRDTDVASMRPWLLRVSLNLARDALRRRKRRGYDGPWLPSPIETNDDGAEPHDLSPDASREASSEGAGERADVRYDRMESVSFAFLVALEALTPKQRAVLLLCDVFGHSVREAAEVLEMTEGAVKTTHHRARAAMGAYDVARLPPTRDLREKTRNALQNFLFAIARGDVASVEASLAADVRAWSDGGGEFTAARVPIVGRQKVARFFLNVAKRAQMDVRWELRTLNGADAVVFAFAASNAQHAGARPRNEAPLVVQLCDVDAEGRVRALYSVLATSKLSGVQAP